MKEAIMIEIYNNCDKTKGRITPEAFKKSLGIPKSSIRFLYDIVKDYNERNVNNNFAIIVLA
jgi:hypothetical protein